MLEIATARNNFILCPIHFRSFNYKEFNFIEQYQFFNVNGKNYDRADKGENLCFAHLVEFDNNNGVNIPRPNSHRDDYLKDLSLCVIEALDEKFNPTINHSDKNNFNDTHPEVPWKKSSTKKKIVLLTLLCMVILGLLYVFIPKPEVVENAQPDIKLDTIKNVIVEPKNYDSIINLVEQSIKDENPQNLKNKVSSYVAQLIDRPEFNTRKNLETKNWPELAYIVFKTRSIISQTSSKISRRNEKERLEKMCYFLSRVQDEIERCYDFENYPNWISENLKDKSAFINFPKKIDHPNIGVINSQIDSINNYLTNFN